jgi:hypothetical protein
MTCRFLDAEPPTQTIGEVLERYRLVPHDDLWMVEHLWYLIGTGELTVSSTPDEAREALRSRRLQRIAVRRSSRQRP